MVVDASSVATTAGPEPGPGTGRRPKRGPAAWVAMYHSISDCPDDPYNVTVTPDRLDRQLAWLRGRGLRVVSVRELLEARARGQARGMVALTFDDGYADFVTAALPILRRRGCSATVFLVTGRLGGENEWERLGPRKQLLDAEGIRRIVAADVEIASHGLTHIDLTRVPDSQLRAEVERSRTALARITGTDVQGFCYPYGMVDERVRQAVRQAGYRYACAIDPDPAFASDLALPRVHIGQSDTPARLELKRRFARFCSRAVETS